jgi:hypothetical protein
VLGGSGDVTVTGEASAFELPPSTAWTQDWNVSYESSFVETTATDADGDKAWGSLFEVASGTFVLLAEADVTGRYCTTRPSTSAGSTTWSVKFPET